MAKYVEITDSEAAKAAGRSLAETAGQLDSASVPPVAWGGPEWGDDDYARKILEKTDYPDLVGPCLEQKQELSEFFAHLGTALQQAIAEYTGEESINVHELNQVQPPNPTF